jgi:cytochrome o ubiquinol oxidase subunit 1
MASLFVGEFARTGWLAYPPLSGILASPDVGVDYYIWSLQIAGVGTLLSGINLIVTIVKMRAPGMDLMKMPVFTWTALCTNILIVMAFPILTVTLAMLGLDRLFDTHFFTNELGGNAMMYVNLIWIWGHPEVYILVLPAFGIFSEVVATFCNKRLFGYSSMVYATVVIMVLSYLVWLHHFFTMGSGASVNSFFGITTMIISIPTGAKIFNWLFTMYKGRIRYRTADDVDRVLHDHLHHRRHDRRDAGGPAGRLRAAQLAVPDRPLPQRDHRRRAVRPVRRHQLLVAEDVRLQAGPFWGVYSFWLWSIGFWVAFMPPYILGFMGVTRRVSHFDDPSIQWLFQILAVRHPDDRRRYRLHADAVSSVDHQPQEAARRHRRPVEWPYPGVGDLVAAAGLQLRVHPGRA